MKRSFTISIKEPCTQSWDEMSPDNAGRFCASCQKTVIDFTKFSDEELISYFQQRKHFGCGRFTEKQLAIKIPDRLSPLLPFWKMSKYLAASMIAAAGLGGEVFAQKNEITQISVENEVKKEDTVSSREKHISIAGIIVDERGEGIPGVAIEVQNSNITTITDIDGRFQLSIPKSSCKNGYFYLNIKSIGYEDLIKAINLSNYYASVSIKLNLSTSILGDICVYRPTKWRRFKFWMKNNFF
jgi:hypothetical protein